jgi:CheY-like chemotaxis protein
VYADVGQIENLLVNLVLNSRDAMPRGGRLAIATTSFEVGPGPGSAERPHGPGAWVRLSVADTGIGMTEAIKARAFEPFFTTKGPGKGTGLGLSTAYGIVRQHRGFISIESEPGRGTVIHVDLLHSGEAPAARERRAETDDPRGTETILLAEDDGGVRSYAVRVLREHGYDVIETQGGFEALLAAEREPDRAIHLLLSDVVMPRMNGPDLRDRLRVTRPGLPTLFISGYAESAALDLSTPESEAMMLRKPFTPQALARKVRDALDGPAPGSSRRPG